VRCGTAEAVITPTAGCWLSGYIFRDHGSEGVLDDLVAQAAVFESEGTRVALVRADLPSLAFGSVKRIRREVHRRAGIPEGNVMLAASHTHAGPALMAIRGMGPVSPDYVVDMEDRIVDCVLRAAESTMEVNLGVGSSSVEGLGIIREGASRGAEPEDRDLKVLSVTPAALLPALQLRMSCRDLGQQQLPFLRGLSGGGASAHEGKTRHGRAFLPGRLRRHQSLRVQLG